MSQAAKSSSFDEDLNEYEHWISMGWGVNRYEDDDIFPIMSMRDASTSKSRQIGRISRRSKSKD